MQREDRASLRLLFSLLEDYVTTNVEQMLERGIPSGRIAVLDAPGRQRLARSGYATLGAAETLLATLARLHQELVTEEGRIGTGAARSHEPAAEEAGAQIALGETLALLRLLVTTRLQGIGDVVDAAIEFQVKPFGAVYARRLSRACMAVVQAIAAVLVVLDKLGEESSRG